MKILIPYDGSPNAELALAGLHAPEFAGQQLEILIVITDVWLPETHEEFLATRAERKRRMELSGICSYSPSLRGSEEAQFLLQHARRRLVADFPSRNVRVEILPGFSLVSSEVLERAETWGAELIVLGARNGGSSGARRVAAEAKCPVRLAGGRLAKKKKSGGAGDKILLPPVTRQPETARSIKTNEKKPDSETRQPDKIKAAVL